AFVARGDTQLWRVAEWLVRKRTLVPKIRAARVVEVAAAAVQAAVVEAAWAAVDLPAAKAEAEVDAPVVAEEVRVVVEADGPPAVVVDKVVAVVDVPPVVAA